MRTILITVILIFGFQSFTKADDIRDFEIEGMSVGNSLLLYSTKQEVYNNMITDYASKKYSRYTLKQINSEPLKQFDDIQVHFKTNDKDLIITSISGGIYNRNKFDECLKMKKDVIKEIAVMFPNAEINDSGTSPWYEADPTGETITSQYFFNLGSAKYNDYIEVSCYDWGEEAGKKYNAGDHFKLALIEKEFGRWLSEEAWK